MRNLFETIGKQAVLATVSLTLSLPAWATLTIVPTFDASITGLPADNSGNPTSPTIGQVEGAINAAIAAIDALFINQGTVPVLFQYNAGLGGGASTSSAIFTTNYTQYTTRLTNDSNANPGNTTLATAVANLPSTAKLTTSFGAVPNISVVAPFANVILGQLTLAQSQCFNGTGAFVGGCGSLYSAVVTVSAPTSSASSVSNYYATPGAGLNPTAVSVAEHELNEVLGGGGAGTTLNTASSGNPTSLGPTDLYRYASTGTGCTTGTGLSTALSWNNGSSTVACYSIDGGTTAFAQFNQAGGGSDFADWAAPSPSIQDAFVPGSPSAVYSALSPEFIMMQSIGYDTTVSSVPEPAGVMLFASALLGLGWLRTRPVRRLGVDR